MNSEWVDTGKDPIFYGQKHADDRGSFRRIPKGAARLSTGSGSFECDQGGGSPFLSFSSSWLARKGVRCSHGGVWPEHGTFDPGRGYGLN